jgi:hypothetical protein
MSRFHYIEYGQGYGQDGSDRSIGACADFVWNKIRINGFLILWDCYSQAMT